MASCVHQVLEHLYFCERQQNVLLWKLNFIRCKWLSCVSVHVNICRTREDKHTAKQESYILQENCEYHAGRADDFVTAGSEVPGGLRPASRSWADVCFCYWVASLRACVVMMHFSVFQISVRVTTMDAELEFAIQPNTTGKQLFDQVSDGAAEDRKLIKTLSFY